MAKLKFGDTSSCPAMYPNQEGGGSAPDGYIPKVNRNGTLGAPTTAFTYTLPSGVTTIPMYGLEGAFENSGLTAINGLSSLITITYNGMASCFYNCTRLSGNIDLSSLTTLHDNGLSGAFYNTNITSVDLSSLLEIHPDSLNNAFGNCINLTSVDLSSLIHISSNGLDSSFSGCTNLTSVDLSHLTQVDDNGLYFAFGNCINLRNISLPCLQYICGWEPFYRTFANTSLSSLTFPALKYHEDWDDESYNYSFFNDMLYGVTGCTVHFPSNLESTVGTWSDTLAGFGGTNTTVLFDLPSTATVNNSSNEGGNSEEAPVEEPKGDEGGDGDF